MHWIFSLCLLAGCDQLFGLTSVAASSAVDANHGPTLPGYRGRKKITLTSSGRPLVDLPISIALNTDPDLARSDSSGDDIVFTTEDGLTILDREIVAFTKATGELDAWVKLPDLQPGNTHLYMYYDGPLLGSASVWSSAYAGVWHLSMSSPVELDSTPHGHHVFGGSARPSRADGVAGHARQFDGANQQLCALTPGDSSLDFAGTNFGISVWVNVSSSVGLWDSPFYRGGSQIADPGVVIELGTGGWDASLVDRNPQIVTLPLTTETLGRWVQVALVVDRATNRARSYIDGVLTTISTLPTLGSLLPGALMCIGSENGKDYFRGLIDEVRVYARAVDVTTIDAAITTEYANLAHRSTFVTVGPAEPLP